jgi:hypothetical protein
MKNLFNYLFISIICISFAACSSDDDSTPTIVNEEEVITTVTLTLTPATGEEIELRSFDADGDGPNPPVVTVSRDLVANTTYTGSIAFLNETESPAEDITLEVQDEADEHQVMFTIGTSLNVNITYADFDADSNPLGTRISLETAEASQGNLTLTLRHEPKKPNDGSLADAGGETDVQVSFPVSIN